MAAQDRRIDTRGVRVPLSPPHHTKWRTVTGAAEARLYVDRPFRRGGARRRPLPSRLSSDDRGKTRSFLTGSGIVKFVAVTREKQIVAKCH